MVLQGWAPWCPLTPLDTTVFSRLTVERGVPSYGTCYCCAPSLPSILPYLLVLMVEGRDRGAPSFPLDTAVFYSFDGGVDGMVLCVWHCGAPSLPLDTAVFSRVDGGVNWSCRAPSLPPF